MPSLRLWKGFNNGPFQATLKEISADGSQTAFDLTSCTITVQIYKKDGTVVASFTGTIITAAEGTYSAKPDADDLDALTPGNQYYWRVKVVHSSNWPQGRLFAEDKDGRLQSVIVEGSVAGT